MRLSTLIEGIDSGSLDSDLSRHMRSLIDNLRDRALESGKAKGEILLKLKFSTEGGGRVEIEAEASIKTPGPRKVKEVQWIGKSGELVTSDPRQEPMRFGQSAKVD